MRWSRCVAFQVLLVICVSCAATGSEPRDAGGDKVADATYLECKVVVGHVPPAPREASPAVPRAGESAQCRPTAEPTPIYGETALFRLASAKPTTDELGYPALLVTLDASETKRFEEWTRSLVGKEMTVFFHGEWLLSATVSSALPGGQAVLSGGAGGWSDEHVSSLVARMNAGR